MNIKIFCRCSLFPSWSGLGLISIPVLLEMEPHFPVVKLYSESLYFLTNCRCLYDKVIT
jgi:hypothetical protein